MTQKIMPDLFDTPLIAGLKYEEELIGAAEERALIERLSVLDLAPFRFHGWLGNRKTQSFGWRYDFDDSSFARTEPIPDWLEPVREKAAAFADLDASDFAHALLASYDPGAGMAGTATAMCSRRSSEFRSGPRRRCAFASGSHPASRASASMSRRARLICCRARRATIGSIASRPATFCAFRSPSVRLSAKGRRVAAAQGNGPAR